MSYNQWIVRNLDALSKNYKSRFKNIFTTDFKHYCEYIWLVIKKNMFIPKEHLKNIDV